MTWIGRENQPMMIGFLDVPRRVYIQVKDASTWRLAHNPFVLSSPALGGIQQGLSFVTGDGVRELVWKGELWVVSSADNGLCEFEIEPLLP